MFVDFGGGNIKFPVQASQNRFDRLRFSLSEVTARQQEMQGQQSNRHDLFPPYPL
jgi:hypothetical protein